MKFGVVLQHLLRPALIALVAASFAQLATAAESASSAPKYRAPAAAPLVDPYRQYMYTQLEADRFQVRSLRTQIDSLRVRLRQAKARGDQTTQTDGRKELRRIYRQESRITVRILASQALLSEYDTADRRTRAKASDQANRATLLDVLDDASSYQTQLDRDLEAKTISESQYAQMMEVQSHKLRLAREALSTCQNCRGAKFANPKRARLSDDEMERIALSQVNAGMEEIANDRGTASVKKSKNPKNKNDDLLEDGPSGELPL
jgi:hypothetical protein